MKFIHAADLHIDSPLWGLDAYEGAPIERIRGATREALIAMVDLALEQEVDLVILAGDIFDGDWQDFGTGLFFRQQMTRLTKQNIRVFIAKGNHDADSRITKELPSVDKLHIFSSNKCDTITLDDLNVAIHGRSFPKSGVDGSFAASYTPAVPGKFNIGVLHTSLTGNSDHVTYAPTSLDVLNAKGYDYFALGHIHIRQVVQESSPRIVFPGNLQGRHAKEIGPKGCELVTVTSGTITSEFVPLDVVRWHQVKIDVTGANDIEALRLLFLEQARAITQDRGDRLHAVRVILDGETELHRFEAAQPGMLAATIQAACQDLSGDNLWVEQVKLNLRLPIDRSTLINRTDALGDVARLADAIAADEVLIREWITKNLSELGSLSGDLAGIHPNSLDVAALRQILADAEATVFAQLSDITAAGSQ
ncbi:MAG: DNA repair exonuclease [Burkholderiales bacterium]|nr:DNA repair exonuclease [Burkholderiales bacterium]